MYFRLESHMRNSGRTPNYFFWNPHSCAELLQHESYSSSIVLCVSFRFFGLETPIFGGLLTRIPESKLVNITSCVDRTIVAKVLLYRGGFALSIDTHNPLPFRPCSVNRSRNNDNNSQFFRFKNAFFLPFCGDYSKILYCR